MTLMSALHAYHDAKRPGWRALEVAGRMRDRMRGDPLEGRIWADINQTLRASERAEIRFVDVREPLVSVLIPVYNNWALTRRCLASLCVAAPVDEFEVIVVDDHSSDETAPALASIPGVRVITNETNLGFTRSVNRAARQARGRYTLFLNNDTLVLPRCVESLLAAVTEPGIGAAGAKLIYPNGRLQEAGGLIWSDGSGWNIGRDCKPRDPEYSFRRDVDYCSAAALMVRSDLLRDIGCFDERFAPAYYEDTDLCFAVRQRGYRVVVEPAAAVLHWEGMTHGTELRPGIAGAHDKSNQARNRALFAEKWADALAAHLPPPDWRPHVSVLRSKADERPRVLVCDWTVPTPDRDSGSQRMDWIVELLQPMTAWLTFVPTLNIFPEYVERLRSRGVEVATGDDRWFTRFMQERSGFYDIVLLSRSTVAERRLAAVRRHQPQSQLIFDTVDLKSLRVSRELAVTGRSTDGELARVRDQERRLIAAASVTAAVTQEEAGAIRTAYPGTRVVVLPNVHTARTKRIPSFQEREGLLFIANFNHQPNVDGIEWFARLVLPLIRSEVDVDVTVIGADPPSALVNSLNQHVRFTGWIPDPEYLFDHSKVFIAPLRYGAGMKGKVGQAMSLGLPVVTTGIGAEGMDLLDGRDVLIRDEATTFAAAVIRLQQDETLWATLSRNAIAAVDAQWSPARMQDRLANLLADIRSVRAVTRIVAAGATSGVPVVAPEELSASARSLG